jgi:poly(3-hydroxybutyrate) depolymerase
MFFYAPENMPRDAPLVIALHGCTQTSDEYDHGTGMTLFATVMYDWTERDIVYPNLGIY